MMAVLLSVLSFVAVVFFLRGVVGLLRWQDRRFEEQIEADFRAHVLMNESKRQARRDLEAEQVNLRG